MDRRAFLRALGVGGVAAGTTLVRPAGSSRATESPSSAPSMFCSTKDHRMLGSVGGPHALDALLYPPPPEPARAGRVREYDITMARARLEVAKGVFFDAWAFNGTVPGPVLRATAGDTLRVRFRNDGELPHSIHFHGTHPASMDGVANVVPPGNEFVYEFTADPFGVFPYHCHVDPLDTHIGKGLYGTLIIDPPEPRPRAHEIVMMMNGFDLDGDGENEVYTVNGVANYHMTYPLKLRRGELVRVYLLNMTEGDPLNSLHIHANMFHVYPNGTMLQPSALTDIVNLGIAERAIVEFTYTFPGLYMFHAHQNEIASKGWMGRFDVQE